MNQLKKLLFLNDFLINEMPEYKTQSLKFAKSELEQEKLFRSLVNIRQPMQISTEFLDIQDEFLQERRENQGIVTLENLTPVKSNIYLWQGDITRLSVEAVVNAANNTLLGCFVPCHVCIDNAIHFSSGVQLRLECNEIMEKQGHKEETGKAKITKAYNLPSKHVIHTVGPIINDELREKDCKLLESCYEKCLLLAIEKNLKSIAFCCISTGEFHFPNDKASEIAVKTVIKILNETKSDIEVVFNVFKEMDYKLYTGLLK